VYAQCARTNSGPYAPQYAPGDVLLLAINLDNSTAATLILDNADTGANIRLPTRRVSF